MFRWFDDGVTPQYKHARKLAKKAKKLKEKRDKIVVVNSYEETVYDTRGQPKKRLVKLMSNGNKYRIPIITKA